LIIGLFDTVVSVSHKVCVANWSKLNASNYPAGRLLLGDKVKFDQLAA